MGFNAASTLKRSLQLFGLMLVASAPCFAFSESLSEVCRDSDIRIFKGVTSQDQYQFNFLNIKFYEMRSSCFEAMEDGFTVSLPKSKIEFRLNNEGGDFSYSIMQNQKPLRADRYLHVFKSPGTVSFTFGFAEYEVPEGLGGVQQSPYIELTLKDGRKVKLDVRKRSVKEEIGLPEVVVEVDGSSITAHSEVDKKYAETIRINFETSTGHKQKVCAAEQNMHGLLSCKERIPGNASKASVIRYRSDDESFSFRESAKTVWTKAEN